MKKANCFGLIALVCLAASARAQVFSQNIVGYANVVLYAGDNLIASQFSNSNNTLNAIFPGGTPEGATFTEWDPTVRQFLPASVYDTASGWSINYELGYGEGGLFSAPTTFTNLFLGNVWSGFNGGSANFVPPLISANGSLLLSSYIPLGGATFYDVVGRDPANGESVTYLDAASQISITTSFDDGAWNNGTPALNLGQAAFFNLGGATAPIVPVPEPAAGALAGIGLICLGAARWWKHQA